MPATQLAPLLALTSLSANYSISFGKKNRASHFAAVKNGPFSFPRFSVGGWYHFECGFVVQTILFYSFFNPK